MRGCSGMFPPFPFLHLLFESLLSKKSLFFTHWGYVIYSPWLCSRSAEGCTALWKSPEGSLCRRARAQGARAELGSGGGCRKGLFRVEVWELI